MTEWLFLLERSEVSENSSNCVRDSERMLPEHCQSSEKWNGKTWPTSPDQDGKLKRIVNHHNTPPPSHHLRPQNIIATGWHLHDFLRRWDLMSLFEFFAGTKIQVKLSGSAPWGIQSLCLTYNAIIERMFFRESAQTIQRLRVGFAVRPP